MHHVGGFLDFKQQKPTGKVKQKRNVLRDSRSLGWKLMLESWSWFLKIVARGVQTSAAGSTPPSRPVTTLEGRLPIVCPSCASQLEIQRTRGAAAAAAAKSLQSCPILCHRHHRRQPTRFLCPWDSPSKNTGVGCHFLLQGEQESSFD